METITMLSQEITESIKDESKYQEETETFLDAEVKLAQNPGSVDHFRNTYIRRRQGD